jgi:hypothetical protein
LKKAQSADETYEWWLDRFESQFYSQNCTWNGKYRPGEYFCFKWLAQQEGWNIEEFDSDDLDTETSWLAEIRKMFYDSKLHLI